MDRTQIYLDDRETAALDRVASASGRTRSDLIREAIGMAYLGTPVSPELAIQTLEITAGAWRRGRSGADYVEALRKGRRLKRLTG